MVLTVNPSLWTFQHFLPSSSRGCRGVFFLMSKLRSDSPSSEYVEHAEHMSVGQYIATRLPTLKPPMHKAPNPFSLLRLLNTQQWLFFLVAFFAWSWDAFDFFTVSLTVEELAEQFNKSASQITWGITLVLMFRSVGSVIFGGRYRRNYTYRDEANQFCRYRC